MCSLTAQLNKASMDSSNLSPTSPAFSPPSPFNDSPASLTSCNMFADYIYHSHSKNSQQKLGQMDLVLKVGILSVILTILAISDPLCKISGPPLNKDVWVFVLSASRCPCFIFS